MAVITDQQEDTYSPHVNRLDLMFNSGIEADDVWTNVEAKIDEALVILALDAG